MKMRKLESREDSVATAHVTHVMLFTSIIHYSRFNWRVAVLRIYVTGIAVMSPGCPSNPSALAHHLQGLRFVLKG